MPKQIWEKGACRDAPTNLFYPDRDSSYNDIANRARAYCHAPCPVLLECLFHGLVTEDRFGIWGGLSPRERSALRRRGSLDRYRAVQHLRGTPFWDLVEQLLRRELDGVEAGAEEAAGGQRPGAEDLPGRQEA
jgi:hypothetical protein